ncbi:HAD family hydrolase [Mucilaginibacter lappiensis]|uniref:Hydrolase of the HAD superfamily n=1 Tax=Mucilaginibacter lappiensis TaxID=354630 RepID=A0A1N6NLP2_9SPHI|nr:HAD family phosphatase [Mucilaginibacter lappiensis]MBB6107906.1 putative hydrolase of the HAD superfamily [Mucilaginibacter lappiensis]MBB6126024.1 putative hydrolase of the HAD superfamily [Mucilaginibacter lappiensis]SIP93015.1 putative hydrolase of the HAD superfamily [Mucilaginibacter lappiensis]
MENIKNIIFDYGNVIFSLNFLRGQAAWKELGINNAADFFGHKQQDEIFDKFDRGEVTADQFRDYIRQKTGNSELTNDQINAAWNSMLVGIESGNHELLLGLKDKYRTFLLSNINEIHYEYIMNYLKTGFGFDSNEHIFEKTYYSHLTGKRKPEPAIFEMVLNENNLNPSETLFIDDSPQHLAAAQKLGIQTFLMTTPDTIQQFFEREKL